MTREPADAATATKDTERRRPGKPCVGGLEGTIPEHDDGTITQQALYPTGAVIRWAPAGKRSRWVEDERTRKPRPAKADAVAGDAACGQAGVANYQPA